MKKNDEWLLEFAKAIDRHSYACGGIYYSRNGKEAIEGITEDLKNKTIEELKKHCR